MKLIRSYLQLLKEGREVITVDEKISPRFQMAAVLQRFQSKPILFTNVDGSEYSVLGNLCTDRRQLALALKVDEDMLYKTIVDALNSPKPVERKDYDPNNWDVNMEADLTKLPILIHYEKEAGPYITSGIVAARFPSSRIENLSIHRMLMLDRKRVVARVVPRHLQQIIKDQDGEADVAVCIGVHPALFLATSLQPAYGVSEYNIANRLLQGGLRLMKCESVDVAVPVDAEIVLEGRISEKKSVEEGPFADLTGTYDEARLQPTIEFYRMHLKKNTIYHAILPAGKEHILFMSIPQELKVIEYLNKAVPKVRGINFTNGGCGYYHCIISIDKLTDGDGKNAILNCFAASHALKLVIAVDSDIDPFDKDVVEWALATRFQADRGLILIEGARGSTLDPSALKKGVTAKLGLDATLPVSADKRSFVRASTISDAKVESIVEKIRKVKG